MPALALNPSALEDSMPPPELIITDVLDRINLMRKQEETTYHVRDYLAESAKVRKLASKPVDADCRVKMCEWCYQVVDFCKFRRETVGIGMSYLDRYLCTPKGLEALCNRKEYQLAAMTALYIAIKLHEPLEMETSLLADLSRGCYNEMEFVDMEQTLLQALKWKVNGPTSLGFVQYFMALIPYDVHPTVGSLIMDYSRYQIELAISEQSFVSNKLSEIAIASILNSLEGIDCGLFPIKLQNKFIRRIEKSSKIIINSNNDPDNNKIEIIQAKLTMLMVSMISSTNVEYNELIQPLIDNEKYCTSNEIDDNKYLNNKVGGSGSISRRSSPKTVMNVMRR